MSSAGKFRVYLSGPISGCTDLQKHKWRDEVKKKYGKHFDFIDPTDELLDQEANSAEFVEADLRAIESSSGLLANMWRESIGTALGLVHASRVGRPVVLADPNFLRHRMLQFYADAVADSALKAAKSLLSLLSAEAGWQVLGSDGRQKPFARQKIISSVGRICRRERKDDIVVPRAVLADVTTELERSDRWIGAAIGSTEIDRAVYRILAVANARGTPPSEGSRQPGSVATPTRRLLESGPGAGAPGLRCGKASLTRARSRCPFPAGRRLTQRSGAGRSAGWTTFRRRRLARSSERSSRFLESRR